MRSVTPMWLYAALDDALVQIGATADAAERKQLVDRVIAAWNLDGRSYHNARYLAYIFERLDDLEGATSEPETLRVAAALRGALEEPGWEESANHRSPAAVPAMVSVSDLVDLGVPRERALRVDALISQLASHNPDADDLEAHLLVDADLAALAAPPQEYREFLSHLREEVPHLSEVDYLRARRAVLRHLLDRPRIFSTPLASQWEDGARGNLEADLVATKAKLSKLSGDIEEEHEHTARKQQEKPRTRSKESRVLRISRAQKFARMDGESRTAQTPMPPAIPPRTTPPEGPVKGEEPQTVRPETEPDYASDTSTLESVADLIENSRPRQPRN